jgi:hypothetical protein
MMIFRYSFKFLCYYYNNDILSKASVKLSLCLTKHHAMKTSYRGVEV